MNCESVVEELVECARRQSEPGSSLAAHLRTCGDCLDRWESEQELSGALHAMRMEMLAQRSSSASRNALMKEFASRHPRFAMPLWGLATAAALLLAIVLHPLPASKVVSGASDSGQSLTAEADSDGFIAVPYAPPLATGELLRVVHTELNPAALASLGVSVDPQWTTQLPADVLEGEDGMPRAVRVSEGDSGEGGF